MEKLEEILRELRPDIDLEGKAFVDDGVLDSFDIVTLVGEIVDAFGVEITVEDIIPENFNSVDAIMELINKKK